MKFHFRRWHLCVIGLDTVALNGNLLCTGSLLGANPAVSQGCALVGTGVLCKSPLPEWPLPPVGLIFSEFPLLLISFSRLCYVQM